ncbi:L-serine ammonia-lyase [Cupriavidus taiwanensis]|uniref:L-serine dehydratase n=1 Tax=Cupriavidus taiwanensis TaxID=164546 RepID=A0A375IRH4_9BURK|nr:L-serine ammonia-lyase [Cupriavidus taiwanensis]SOZ29946.1 L-serine deaminase I [Cupriavidus taiwanensis]SPA34705.1 L-serine deaminase I [Cupriavidus taiwanensis]SPA52298.1 L-serine deaminase I [Cupriavidus taiwanensis]SPK75825.1 L-serine deaminase I [Cupriavidus taiwanensis]
MPFSALDLFKIGIGPSSSHTVGPMRAARQFVQTLDRHGSLGSVTQLRSELYGSLGATGKGHGSDTAILLGLSGHDPDTVDVARIPEYLAEIHNTGTLALNGGQSIAFDARKDVVFYRRSLPLHANGMRFVAIAADGAVLRSSMFYSIGGGFVVPEPAMDREGMESRQEVALPLPFDNAEDLLAIAGRLGISIAEIMRRNEETWRPAADTRGAMLTIWKTMQDCVARGCRTEGVLPGGFQVRRRAAPLFSKLSTRGALGHMLDAMDWVTLFALAVNEENAAGGRVVTAPTNGAAGIIPAVLHYYMKFEPGACEEGVVDFLLTAAAIGILFKKNASISGAEVGCQGEVGVACSMAAAGLCAVLGGTVEQVENAAEIAMEHHLGLTCDPVGGLVQIPCIERNAIGAIKAIGATRMALHGDGRHHVSLDKVIKTMRETGADMKTKYKETARGGLAVNIIEC